MGEGEGQWFEIGTDDVVLGRDSDCDITLQDPRASRRHAEVSPRDGRYILKDLGSTNGTRLGSRLVTEAPLSDGDKFFIGGTAIIFRDRAPALSKDGGRKTIVFAAPVLDHDEPPIQEDDSFAIALREIGSELLGPRTFTGKNPDLEFLHFKLSLIFRLVTEAGRLARFRTPAALGGAIADLVTECVRPDRFALLGAGGDEVYRRDRQTADGALAHPIVQRARETVKAHLARYEGNGEMTPRAVMVSPLAVEEKPVGFIYVDNARSRRPFLLSELRILALIAAVSSVFIENTSIAGNGGP